MKCAVWQWLLCLLPLLLLLPEASALKGVARIQEADVGDADDDSGGSSDDSQSADTNADDSSSEQDSSDNSEGEDEAKDADSGSEDQSNSDDNSDSQDQAVTTTAVSVTKAAVKPRRKTPGALDVSGLSQSLKQGGVEGLTRMLSAWKAARGNRNMDAQFHIKRDANGHAVYDFHDMFKKPETTTLPPLAVPTEVPGDLAKGLAKNLLKAQRATSTLPPPSDAAEPAAQDDEKLKPSPKVAKVAGIPSPDELMKQLLGALPPGMSNQIKLNVEKKDAVKSTESTTSSKAPVPVTTQAATTQVVTTQTPHPAVPVSTLALHTTVAATTPHPVTTQAPVPVTTRASVPVTTTPAPVPVTTHAAKPAATTKAPVPVTTSTAQAAVVQAADDNEVDDFADEDVEPAKEQDVPAGDSNDQLTALSQGLTSMRMSLDTMIGEANTLASQRGSQTGGNSKELMDMAQKLSALDSEVKGALANRQTPAKMQEELAKQAQQLSDMRAAQTSEAAELSKVEQDNRKLHAEIRKLVHRKA
mmetsp:Transcript_54477/g.127243  ORF Transcript_54477/g.127243 Transcript_54477/m.127243 type:complete len:529 (-) Transcript_54477:90-1676(-)